MKLFYSITSPFARKVHMLLRVTGLIERTELVSTTFESEELRKLNPLGKIPALVDGDTTLFDSALICEYLDEIHQEEGNRSLFHCGRGDYFRVQSAHYLANGILDAAVLTVMERRRTSEQSAYWLERWQTAIRTGIETVDLGILGGADNLNIATLTTLSALGYLDFRLPDYDWRSWNPTLADWNAELATQDWYQATAPQD